MPRSRVLEQHIAVFGESGSGKTVLLSSFYGAAQQAQNIKENKYHVVAENPSQGTRLSQNYLGMKNSGKLPPTNRFAGTSFPFLLKLREDDNMQLAADQPYDALRLVWHDYPGEWFEHDVSGPEEAGRRVESFRELLESDVAVLLVDGQRVLDNAGEEERYFKSLMTNFCNSLLLLRDDLLPGGKRLVKFPRIWVFALSKADLLPELDVPAFRDLLIEKAGEDIEKLRDVLAGLVESSDALSVGEDFALLSSARFTPKKIEVSQQIGLDLILPLASVLPFERHLVWVQRKQVARKVALALLGPVEELALALGVIGGFIRDRLGTGNKVAAVIGFLITRLSPFMKDGAARLINKLNDSTDAELRNRNSVAAVLVGFEADLMRAESESIFLRRP